MVESTASYIAGHMVRITLMLVMWSVVWASPPGRVALELAVSLLRGGPLFWLTFLMRPTEVLRIIWHAETTGHSTRINGVNFRYSIFCDECETCYIDELG
jgi:hypothetical protein